MPDRHAITSATPAHLTQRQTRLVKAIGAVCETSFAAGEWNRDDDEPFDRLDVRSTRAVERLYRLLDLPPNANQVLSLQEHPAKYVTCQVPRDGVTA